MFTYIFDSVDFAFNPTLTKAWSDENPIEIGDFFLHILFLQIRGVNRDHLDFYFIGSTCMYKRFQNRFVRILQLNILSDKSNSYSAFWVFVTFEKILPVGQVGLVFIFNSQSLHHHLIKTLLIHQYRHVINSLCIDRLNDSFLLDIAKQGQFFP